MLIPGSSNQERYEFIYNIKDPNQGLINAVKIGSLFLVKYYLEQGAKLNKKILRLAAKNGHLDVIKYLVDGVNKGRASHVFLIEQGADIHNDDEETLRLAAEKGRLDVVKYLVEQGADLHARDEEALRLAAENGHLDVVKYLVEQGADLHARYELDALQSAVMQGHFDVVKYLIEQGANIDEYALRLAAENGHLDVVKYLVEQGATINELALQLAAERGYLDIVKYLVEQVSNNIIANNFNYSQIVNFCQTNKAWQYKEFWQMLISQRYPKYSKDKLYESNPGQLFKQLELNHGYYLAFSDGDSLFLDINLNQDGIGAGYLILKQFDPAIKIVKSGSNGNVANCFTQKESKIFLSREQVKDTPGFSFGIISLIDPEDREYQYFIDNYYFNKPSFLLILDEMMTFAGLEAYYYSVSIEDKDIVEIKEVTP